MVRSGGSPRPLPPAAPRSWRTLVPSAAAERRRGEGHVEHAPRVLAALRHGGAGPAVHSHSVKRDGMVARHLLTRPAYVVRMRSCRCIRGRLRRARALLAGLGPSIYAPPSLPPPPSSALFPPSSLLLLPSSAHLRVAGGRRSARCPCVRSLPPRRSSSAPGHPPRRRAPMPSAGTCTRSTLPRGQSVDRTQEERLYPSSLAEYQHDRQHRRCCSVLLPQVFGITGQGCQLSVCRVSCLSVTAIPWTNATITRTSTFRHRRPFTSSQGVSTAEGIIHKQIGSRVTPNRCVAVLRRLSHRLLSLLLWVIVALGKVAVPPREDRHSCCFLLRPSRATGPSVTTSSIPSFPTAAFRASLILLSAPRPHIMLRPNPRNKN